MSSIPEEPWPLNTKAYYGVFTLTETDKKWVLWDCVEVFILTGTDTVTDANGFQTHFIGLGLGLFIMSV